jgi:SAM-dependent methyltransferase
VAFPDLFSRQASAYASARPTYPDALYQFVAAQAPSREVALDCGTGSGQAARDLARYFGRVIAIDASAEQIAEALPVSNVEYRVAPAEATGLAPHSVDLLTVAQALHWFDHDRFYAEVRRVTVPGGVVAAWCYGACHVGADLEAALLEFQEGTVGPFWHAGRRWVDEGYRTIPFPFVEIPAPSFELRLRWSLSQLGEYFGSWSAVAGYRRELGQDPVAPLMERIAAQWGPADHTREITWPLGLRIGRV